MPERGRFSQRHGDTEGTEEEKLSRRHEDTKTRGRGDTEITENEIGTVIVDCAVKLHLDLGPGLLESVYEALLSDLLQARGLEVERQVVVPLEYNGKTFAEVFRIDLLVGDKVIVELKTVESLTNAHKKQLLTYLRLSDKRLGYLLNFSEAVMKDGITRIINGDLTTE